MEAVPSECLLRRAGPPHRVAGINGVQVDDERLAAVLHPDSRLLCLYDQALHGEAVPPLRAKFTPPSPPTRA